LMFIGVPAHAQAPVCFAAPGGNDLNDGSYWAFAKADVMACYDALPPTGGTIYLKDAGRNGRGVPTCSPNDPQRCGIWIMGPRDPNYFHPPAGWRKAKPVKFVGVGGSCMSQQGSSPQVCVSAGSPGIWLSSSTTSVDFENLAIAYPNPSVEIGVDSSGNQSNTSGWVGARFSNLFTLVCNSCSSMTGPGWLIGGGNSFDIHITRSVIAGNPNAPPGSDNQAAILIKPTAYVNVASPIYIDHTIFTGGGLKEYRGANPQFLFAEDVYSEGINGGSVSTGVGTLWFPNGGVNATVNGIFTSDASGAVCDVVNASTDPSTVFYVGGQVQSVCGPAEVHGPTNGYATETPARAGQIGFSGRHVYGQVDVQRRAFSPSIARFTNQANQNMTAIGLSAVAAPDGTKNAGELTGSIGPSVVGFYSNGGFSGCVGCWIIAGVWVRDVSGLGYYNGLAPAEVTSQYATFTGPSVSGSGTAYLPAPWPGDGEWEWVWTAAKVTANSGTGYLDFEGKADMSGSTPRTTDYFAPVFIVLGAGTVSDNEAVEIASNLSSYRSGATAGQVSLLPGEQLKADSIQVGDGPIITSGLGPPKGSASPGSIYLRRDGAPGSTFYIYEKDGWKAQF